MTSRKEIVPSLPTRNSTVPAPTYPASLRMAFDAIELGDLLSFRRRRGLLDQLLVAALQRAVTGEPDPLRGCRPGTGSRRGGLVQVALDEAFAATEGGDRSRTADSYSSGTSSRLRGDLQAPPATAEGGLDGDRQAVLLGEGHDLVGADRVGGAGHRGAPARWAMCRAATLSPRSGWPAAAGRSRSGRRPARPGRSARSRRGTRSRGGRRPRRSPWRPGGPCRCPGSWWRGCRRPGRSLVRSSDVQGVPVRVGVHGHARDPGVTAGPGDTDSDFATVGDQHLAHDGSLSLKQAEFRDCRHDVSTRPQW